MIELHYWEGMSGPRIAELLELPAGTVASRIRLAKQSLIAGMGFPAQAIDEAAVLLALDEWARDIASRLRGR